MSKRAPADGSEWSTIVLLMLGAFFVGIGWVVGVVALWRSRVWTVPEKLIGTLLWPGGLVTGLFFAVLAFQAGGALIAVGDRARSSSRSPARCLLYRRAQQSSTS